MCERLQFPDGNVAIVCGVRRRRRPPCACGAASEYECDGPRRHHAGKSPTCDRPLCRRCRIHVPPNQDFCSEHRQYAKEAAAQLRLFDGAASFEQVK
jgi:hypothetical protein